MKKIIVLLTVILVFVAVVPTFANSLQGMRGLIKIPIADTPPEGKFGLNFQVIGSKSSLGANYGLWENFEVYLNLDTKTDFANPEVTGGIKARVLRETRTQPSLAIGLKNQNLFVVASKTLDYQTNIRGHIGFGTGDNSTKGFDGLFLGFSKLYNPITITSSGSSTLIPVTNFKVEFFNNEINLGTDFKFNENFIVNIGIIDFEDLTYGLGYTSYF